MKGSDGQCVCYSLSTSFCARPYTLPSDTSSYFDPKPENVTVAPPSGKRVKVWHGSDFHLDPRYMVGAEANCSEDLCCQPAWRASLETWRFRLRYMVHTHAIVPTIYSRLACARLDHSLTRLTRTSLKTINSHGASILETWCLTTSRTRCQETTRHTLKPLSTICSSHTFPADQSSPCSATTTAIPKPSTHLTAFQVTSASSNLGITTM